MYKFIKTADLDNKYDNTKVIVSTDTVSLDDLLQSFGDFLRGCGFVFDGELAIVNETQDSLIQSNKTWTEE